MARIISPFGKIGPWSPPLAFRLDASRLDQKDPVIKQAIFFSANGAGKTDRLAPGKWYTLHLSLGPKGFKQDLGIAMYCVSANKAKQWFFHKPYDPRRSFLINLALNRKSVWGPRRAYSTNFREYTGRRGLYLDGTSQGFTIDRKQGKAELKFRFPKKAERGTWILRLDLRGKFSTQYNRLFFLGSEEQKKWRIIIIPLLVVLATGLIAALIYGAARKRRAEKAPPKYRKVIDAVTQRIQKEYKQEIDFSDLAQSLGYSEPNLRKIFRQYTGATPLQYLITLRLNRARDMLETSDDTINEIMYSVGFSDPSYFIQSFKKRFGMTPSQWREKRGKSF
jgi:AraC-like DNA-binding protein